MSRSQRRIDMRRLHEALLLLVQDALRRRRAGSRSCSMAGLDSAVLNPCTLVKQDLVSANQVRSFELGINVCVLVY